MAATFISPSLPAAFIALNAPIVTIYFFVDILNMYILRLNMYIFGDNLQHKLLYVNI